MAGFYLYTSNRIEHLIPLLGDQIRTPVRSIFDYETIVVQSKGMAQWLSLQLASYLKINAFCQFPFPQAFFTNILSQNAMNLPEKLLFTPELLTWKIYQCLPVLKSSKHFEPIQLYLEDNDQLKLFQLSKKIADLFDQYTMFRPDMIELWESDDFPKHWQAALWRSLSKNNPAHRVHLRHSFVSQLKNGQINPDNLPLRVSFFGISSLPPFFLEILDTLSQIIDIHYFLLNPCAEFWDDIVSEKELITLNKKRKHLQKKTINTYTDHYETLNPLLASMGIYGRDFLARLHQTSCDEQSLPVQTTSDTLLSNVQNQILTLSSESKKTTFKKGDRSIQVHTCHSRYREVEVLHDSLLHLLDTVSDCALSDIVVMAPDIEEYASAVRTVFGAAQSNYLPFSLTDRSLKENSSIAEALIEILAIVNSRFTSVAVINLLEIDEVREKFGITLDDLLKLKNWIKTVGIRWAADSEQKTALSLPPTNEHSWKSGLDQLMLGFALPSADLNLFHGIAGCELVNSSSSGELIGKFLDFYNALLALNTTCRNSYTLAQWSDYLKNTLTQFFKADSTAAQYELGALEQHIQKLATQQQLTEFENTVPFDVIKVWLTAEVCGTRVTHGFLSGSITFCSLLPMRGIPFKIICLLGMNEGVFPRRSAPLSWDLIADSPRKGDRVAEIEDRYVFLETLMSAREVLYISYIGQDIQNDTVLHPSVCVEELLDYIDSNFAFEHNDSNSFAALTATRTIRSELISKHRLHSFNPLYFKADSKLFSYREQSLAGALKMFSHPQMKKPFFNAQLPMPELRQCQITINDLINFFSNPSNYILNKRLDIVFNNLGDELETAEPFDFSSLEKYGVSEHLFNHIQKNGDKSENVFENYYKALNLLPHGEIGSIVFNDIFTDVKTFSSTVSNYLNNNVLEDLQISFACNPVTISGQLGNIFKDYMLLFRNASVRPKDYLNAWIKHLLLNTEKSGDYPHVTILISRDEIIPFQPVKNASEILNALVNLYCSGNQAPLRFFPGSSLNYAETFIKKGIHETALTSAYKSWFYNNEWSKIPAESEDPYNQMCFPEQAALNDEFVTIALKVYNPLLSNIIATSDKGE